MKPRTIFMFMDFGQRRVKAEVVDEFTGYTISGYKVKFRITRVRNAIVGEKFALYFRHWIPNRPSGWVFKGFHSYEETKRIFDYQKTQLAAHK